MVVLCVLSVTGSEVRHFILFYVYSNLIKLSSSDGFPCIYSVICN